MSNEDLLYWNLSCPLTFDISVYQEGGCPLGGNYHEAPLDFWTQFRTFTKGLNNIAFFNVQNQNRPLDAHDLAKGRIHSKKKVVNFHNWGGGGSSQNVDIFTTFFSFFFACSNSSISAIKFFCLKGLGVPPDQYTLKTYQLNIDFFKSFLGFQGRNFLILYIMIFWSWSQKKKK